MTGRFALAIAATITVWVLPATSVTAAASTSTGRVTGPTSLAAQPRPLPPERIRVDQFDTLRASIPTAGPTPGGVTFDRCILYQPGGPTRYGSYVHGYGKLDCSSASTFIQSRLLVCNYHLTWPFWIRNDPCDDHTNDFTIKQGEAINQCTSGTHDWEVYSRGEVWFSPNGYGAGENLSALPNPQYNC